MATSVGTSPHLTDLHVLVLARSSPTEAPMRRRSPVGSAYRSLLSNRCATSWKRPRPRSSGERGTTGRRTRAPKRGVAKISQQAYQAPTSVGGPADAETSSTTHGAFGAALARDVAAERNTSRRRTHVRHQRRWCPRHHDPR